MRFLLTSDQVLGIRREIKCPEQQRLTRIPVCSVDAKMDPKRVNEFLPPASSAPAPPADRMDATPMEDDFDVAQYRALKKDKQEEQKRLDHEHDHRHRQLEEQVHLENNRLYSQLQQRVNESIQRAFIDLQPAIAATINNQVSLRLEQQRLRDEHAASKTTIEQRYHNKITSLMAMPSAARSAMPRVNSNSSTPSHPQTSAIRVSQSLYRSFYLCIHKSLEVSVSLTRCYADVECGTRDSCDASLREYFTCTPACEYADAGVTWAGACGSSSSGANGPSGTAAYASSRRGASASSSTAGRASAHPSF